MAIWSGIAASSLALIAFGADSYLEVAAAALVLWRVSVADSERAEAIEQRAVRFIGWTFLALAVAIAGGAGWTLSGHSAARESLPGIVLAALSVTVMPGLALWKLHIAARGNLQSIAIEAKESIACSYLSLTLLVGLAATALLGWWWLDSVTALLLTPWLVREGLEGIRGEHEEEGQRICSCRACLYGLKDCHAPCCTG